MPGRVGTYIVFQTNMGDSAMTEKNRVVVKIAILTVSDSRTEADDTSGDALVERLTDAGHQLVVRSILPDDKYKLRELVSRWIADSNIDVIISTGGTGITLSLIHI